MTFKCVLEVPGLVVPSLRVAQDPEALESRDVAIMRGCAMLAETDAKFVIGGFGDDDWQFDIEYEMSMILESLPDALRDIKAGHEGVIDIYTQGRERALRFIPDGDRVRIRCMSMTDWTPIPAEESRPAAEVVGMLERLAYNFAKAILRLDGSACDIEPIGSWSRGLIELLIFAPVRPFACCMPDCADQPGCVVVVESGHGVAETDGNACGEAGR